MNTGKEGGEKGCMSKGRVVTEGCEQKCEFEEGRAYTLWMRVCMQVEGVCTNLCG